MSIESFIEACKKGNFSQVKFFIDQGIDPNSYYVIQNKEQDYLSHIYPLWLVMRWELYQNETYNNTKENYLKCAYYLIKNGASLDKYMYPQIEKSIRELCYKTSMLKSCEDLENDLFFIKGAIDG